MPRSEAVVISTRCSARTETDRLPRWRGEWMSQSDPKRHRGHRRFNELFGRTIGSYNPATKMSP
jgi:hypothetical protein